MAYRSAFELFKPSKDAVLQNLWPFLVFVFLPAFLSVIGDAASGNMRIDYSKLSSVLWRQGTVTIWHFLGGLLSILFLPAYYYLELQAAKGRNMGVGETFRESMRYFWPMFGLVLAMGGIILLGLIAFIVPGIIFIQRYFLAPYFLLDKNMGIKEALAASAQASKGRTRAIWGVIGVAVLLNLFNVVPIFGGLIAALLLMLYACAPAYRYLELSGKPGSRKQKTA